jgi:hydroxyacylglutathione hydrolase
MFKIIAIPAFQDNYIWAIHNNHHVIVVDPGDAVPVLAYLATENLILSGIFCTHRHNDHVGGIEKLRAVYNVPVYGRQHPLNSHISHPVVHGEKIMLDAFNLVFEIIDVPGHLDDHIAFFSAQSTPEILFCGDVLFGAGCGKNFEGEVEALHCSLQRLAQLPDSTLIYCAHEYTASNLRFAALCEPGNLVMQQRIIETKTLRDANTPTVPSTLALEKATNPFLRCEQQEIIKNLQKQGLTDFTSGAVFKALRKWRDCF